MKSLFLLCALFLAGPGGITRADARDWNWRFRPAAQSHWQMVIFQRLESRSAEDMIQFSLDQKGTRKQSLVRQETLDQASHRVVFDVDVVSGDAQSSQLRWTFRSIQVTRERDAQAESTLGDGEMPADLRLQVQKQRRLAAQKSRNEEKRAAQRFTQSLGGAGFSCSVTSAGRVTRYGSWDVWKKRVEGAISDAKDGNFLSMAFRPLLVPDEMKPWIAGWIGGLPAAPLQNKQSWQFSARVADLGFLTPLSTASRTLQSHDEQRAVVDETAAFSVAPPVPKLQPNTVAYTFKCQGKRTARLQIDEKSGIPIRTSRRLELQGHRGVVNEQGRSLQDEAFSQIVTSEIVIQPRSIEPR